MTQDVLCSPKSPNRASGTQNRFHNICPILVILALLLILSGIPVGYRKGDTPFPISQNI